MAGQVGAILIVSLSLLATAGAVIATLALGVWGSDVAMRSIQNDKKRARTRWGLWGLAFVTIVLFVFAQTITDREVAAQEAAATKDAHAEAQAQLNDYQHYLDSKLAPLLKAQSVTVVAEPKSAVRVGESRQTPAEALNPIHITDQEMTYNPLGGTKLGGSLALARHVQVSVNLYVQSDFDGSLVHAEAFSIGANIESYTIKRLNAERVLATAQKALSDRLARPSDLNPLEVTASEQYWFTISGPIFNTAQYVDFRNNKYLVYIAGVIRVEHGKAASERTFCVMNGGDPEVLLECPKS